jgi:1-acyl-sn-glycerol-3-phosphate acyltransferase
LRKNFIKGEFIKSGNGFAFRPRPLPGTGSVASESTGVFIFSRWRLIPNFPRVRALIYHASRLVAKLLFAPFVKLRVLRPELARRDGAWILAANHISHFDPPLIGIAAGRKIDWMGMRELFHHPLIAAWLRAIDSFPVDRAHLDRPAVRAALAHLRAGHALGMFPEGGIRDGLASVLEGAPARPGAAGLSLMTGAPIIPCVIIGSDRCYALRRLWRPGWRIPVWVGFGAPLAPESGRDRAGARAALESGLADAFRGLATEMRLHFELTDDDMPQSATRRRRQVEQRDTAGSP